MCHSYYVVPAHGGTCVVVLAVDGVEYRGEVELMERPGQPGVFVTCPGEPTEILLGPECVDMGAGGAAGGVGGAGGNGGAR